VLVLVVVVVLDLPGTVKEPSTTTRTRAIRGRRGYFLLVLVVVVVLDLAGAVKNVTN
jgi:hypothetical protein